jgi:HD-like signal output (HDOD) protein
MSTAINVDDEVIEIIRQDLGRGTGDLPMLPRAAAEALRLANTKDIDFEKVAEIAESDPPLAARFLGVANSALYFRGVVIRSIHQAVVRLGAQTTRDVLYMAVYGSAVFHVPEYEDIVDESFKHSVLVGQIARRVSGRFEVNADSAFLAGLLHEMGRGRCFKIAAGHTILRADRNAVIRAVDVLYPDAGAQLAEAWHLPDEVVKTCRLHRDPQDHVMARLIQCCIPIAHYGRGSNRYAAGQPGSTPADSSAAIGFMQAAQLSDEEAQLELGYATELAAKLDGAPLLGRS